MKKFNPILCCIISFIFGFCVCAIILKMTPAKKLLNSNINSSVCVNGKYEELYISEDIFKQTTENPSFWIKELQENYGFDEDTATNLCESPENWLAFVLRINVSNETNDRILLSSFKCKNNGKNGIYIGQELEGYQEIGAGISGDIYTNVFYEGNEPSEAEVFTDLKKNLKVELGYCVVPNGVDADTIKTEPIEFFEVN